MKTWRKGSALLLVGMMVLSGLVAVCAPVFADENTTISAGSGETYTIAWNDNYMIDHAGVLAADEQIVINSVAAGNRLIYLGEDELQLQFSLTATADPGEDVTVAVQGTGTVSVGDDTGGQIATGGWGGGTVVVTFTIDTADVGDVETVYPLTVRVTEDTNGNSGTIGIQVYVSSIWHSDNTDALMDAPYELPDVIDNSTGTPDAPFEAGDTFKAALLQLNNDAPYGITELNGTLTSNDAQIVLYNDIARMPSGTPTDGNAYFNYRVDIAPNTPPGDDYTGDFVCEYLRNDAGIDHYVTENVRTTHFAVDFSFADTDPYTPGAETLWSEFQCYATDVVILNSTRQVDYVAPYTIPTIDQSTYTDEPLRVEVTIVNNGNTPLYNVEFEIDPTGFTYFRNPRFFWDDAGTLDYDTITEPIDVFDVGDSVTFTIEMIVMNDIPIGEHRLPILYRGFYFDDGSLGAATGFIDTNGGTDLEVIFSLWVDDGTIAVHVSNIAVGGSGDKDDITAETITVTIVNDEQYDFIDIMVTADFTGTPWYMPVIGMSNPLVDANEANAASPTAAWAAGGNLVVTFDVDTDPSLAPDRYPFTMEITAVIEETLQIVTINVDYTQGAVIDYTGYGPEIFISAFTADDIIPGEDFDLVLTLENTGDDTLRDVTVMILTDGTYEYDWDLEQEFKQQFDWSDVYANWMDVSGPITIPDDMFYTMDDLDVDNVREIVEINLYMDGVYSQPGARIELIHIIDLAPGASFDVTFQMFTDKDMVNGKPYDFPVEINGIDSEGNDYEATRWISVMSSLPGSSYNPTELDWFDAGIKALGLFLFFIIVLAILLFVYNMFKGDPYDEDEDDFDFEDDEPDFEPAPPAPEPEAPAEELVEP